MYVVFKETVYISKIEVSFQCMPYFVFVTSHIFSGFVNHDFCDYKQTFMLLIHFCRVSVDEVSRNISLTVNRERGTFGDVSVYFYVNNVIEGTNLGLDYKVVPQVRTCLYFGWLYTCIILFLMFVIVKILFSWFGIAYFTF